MADSSQTALANGEPRLVAEAKAGSTAAFEELVGRYKGKIYRLGLNITGSHEDGEDVLQETSLKAFEHLTEFRGDSSFYTWIVRIAINEGLMKLRKRHFERSVSPKDVVGNEGEVVPGDFTDRSHNPEQLLADSELGAILEHAVSSLPPSFRAVYFLRYVDGLSIGQTAALLRLAVGTVKARICWTRARLRMMLSNILMGDEGRFSRRLSHRLPGTPRVSAEGETP